MIYEFVNYSLDLARRELRCDGQPIHVEPQTFDVLQYLSRIVNAWSAKTI